MHWLFEGSAGESSGERGGLLAWVQQPGQRALPGGGGVRAAQLQPHPGGQLCGHLYLGVAASSLNVFPVRHSVLHQLPSRRGSQDRGVVLLLKHARLVANGDSVTG